ncbi:MAG: hypothetical protein NXH97_12855 [Rhodobacteraceae bacterium]|nr:hypothetical protein [Paracoccaceae bacterium]
MCLSAEVNFVASAVIGAVGVATLSHTRHPREVLFAAMPLLFALHQFTEGFVWLGLEGYIGELAFKNSAFLFILYAQGILPFLMPLAVLLIEEVPWRRRVIGWITGIAAVFCVYMIWGVMAFPTECYAEHRSIVYKNSVTENIWTVLLYVFVTCGALILSGHFVVRMFGLLNLVGLTVVMIVKLYAFSSLWCFYAALLSVFLYWQFRQRNISVSGGFRDGKPVEQAQGTG